MAARKSTTPVKGKPAPKRPAGRNPNPAKGSANSPAKSAKSAKSAASSLLSIKNIGNLRDTTKQWLKYMQQADVFLDTLYTAGSSLNESGVLQKILKQKGKNLSTGDFTAILMALMNTPLADRFFKSGGNDSSGSQEQAQQSVPNSSSNESHTESQPALPPSQAQPTPAIPQAPVQRPAQPYYQQPGYWQAPGNYPGNGGQFGGQFGGQMGNQFGAPYTPNGYQQPNYMSTSYRPRHLM